MGGGRVTGSSGWSLASSSERGEEEKMRIGGGCWSQRGGGGEQGLGKGIRGGGVVPI